MAEVRRVCPTCGAGYGADALFCPKDGAPLGSRKQGSLADPYLGLTVDAGVRIERLIGIGSMARVYRAHQSGLERPVAVKILHGEHAKNETLVARFDREGRVASSIVHPNVVAIHAMGAFPRSAPTDGEPYLVMELMDGLSLRSALSGAGGALPTARALHVILQVADALGEAHARGVVHRDVKPENVMLVRCGEDPDFAKVVDFGVARVGAGDSSVATHAGAILGTATYACPETARGEDVGPAGDVYALTAVLFECFAGRPPFQGPGPVDVLIQHAQAAPPDVRGFATSRDVPAPLAELVQRNLAKHPGERAPSARELGRSIVAAVRGTPLGDRVMERTTLLGPANGTTSRAPEDAPLESAAPRRTLRELSGDGGRPA